MKRLISLQKSIIPACDVADKKLFEDIIEQTCDVSGVGAYKIGLELTIRFGLKNLVDIVRKYTTLPVMYDHQKGGTDIPALGSKFAKACVFSGVDAVILFPFGGLTTEKEWIKACQDVGLKVIVGGHMTQERFLESDSGFIADNGPQRIYETAIESGVKDFVVPGNQPEFVLNYKNLFESKGISFDLYAPGFITQGGSISDCGRAAGEQWHAIVGSAIYKSPDMKSTTKSLARALSL